VRFKTGPPIYRHMEYQK